MGQWKHRLTNLNTELKTADCSSCGTVSIRHKSGVWKCRNALKLHKGKQYYKYKYKYKHCEQRPIGPCEICGDEVTLVWDHCHTTNEFRGWLCSLCNIGLGIFRDDADRLNKAIKYLNEKGPKVSG